VKSRLAIARLTPVFLLYVLLTDGCAYRLGSTLPPGIRTVHIANFVNHSGEPQLEVETTRAVIQEFQKDGTLRVAAADAADLSLTVTLTGFALEPLRYDSDQAKTTSEYRLRITARLQLKRNSTGKEMLDKAVEGETTLQPGADLTSAKVEATPAAAADLAHDIVESVVEYW
jgi:hypothetical protein